MDDASMKRKAPDSGAGQSSREQGAKRKKQWRVPHREDKQNGRDSSDQQYRGPSSRAIEPGDSGIWATCARGREGKCVGELRDLFAEYAHAFYLGGDEQSGSDHAEGEVAPGGIEAEIASEIAGLRGPNAVAGGDNHLAVAGRLFTPVKLGVQCVIFFKTTAPVEPVSFVRRVCEEAMRDPGRKRTRFALRICPMTLMGRASVEGLDKVAREVLAPHFHTEPFTKRKFAIRTSLRNHTVLKRDSIIKQVATIVGEDHEVDLKNYELLIIVEVYQNVCGVAVVDDSFERLKRYNLTEIFEPTQSEAGRVRDAESKATPAVNDSGSIEAVVATETSD